MNTINRIKKEAKEYIEDLEEAFYAGFDSAVNEYNGDSDSYEFVDWLESKINSSNQIEKLEEDRKEQLGTVYGNFLTD